VHFAVDAQSICARFNGLRIVLSQSQLLIFYASPCDKWGKYGWAERITAQCDARLS